MIDGLLFYDGDSDDASLNPALNAAMLLERFVPMASTAEKKVAYQVCETCLRSRAAYSERIRAELRQKSSGLRPWQEFHVR